MSRKFTGQPETKYERNEPDYLPGKSVMVKIGTQHFVGRVGAADGPYRHQVSVSVPVEGADIDVALTFAVQDEALHSYLHDGIPVLY